MNPSLKNRQLPYNNPIANALVVVVGVLAIAVSFVVGFVALFAMASAALVLGAIIGLRIWWLNRKMSRTTASRGHGAPGEHVAGKGSTVIEGEYQVLQGQKDGAEPPQT